MTSEEEVNAIKSCCEALATATDEELKRIIQYLWTRYVRDPTNARIEAARIAAAEKEEGKP
jgi:hypothetical protein